VPRPSLLPLEEAMSRLERVLADSPADRTEITWIELRHGREGTREGTREDIRQDIQYRRDGTERLERTVVLRVWERGRTGSHRTGVAAVSELSAAVREALGQARLAPAPAYSEPAHPALPSGTAPSRGDAPAIPLDTLFDPAIADLEPAAARRLLGGWTERGDAARLGWVEGQVAVAASDGLRAAVRATAVALEIRGGAPAAGSAAAAARTLAGLDGAEVQARFRRREGSARDAAERPGEPPATPCPLLLAPEAAAALLGLLNRTVLASAAYRDGSSPLCGNLGTALFDRAITLWDDGTDPRGLPFPFDLAGLPKRPVELIREGVVLTPALDEPLAAELGRPATPHALSPDEGLATNLFLRPGARSDEDLRREVGEAGGLWVGSLDAIELYDPAGRRFRARAGGVRRIADGELGEPLPDLFWEDRLPDALTRLIGVGDRPTVVGAAEPLLLFLGGISSPALAVDLRGRSVGLYAARG
jgi:predicted Zn-dependent protease